MAIYQLSMFETFSNYQKWTLFIDENEYVWFYDCDMGHSIVLIKVESLDDEKDGINYVFHDYAKEKIKLPELFKEKVEN